MTTKIRARNHQQQTPSSAATTLRPPARSTNNPHRTHKDHFNRQITIVVWSHSFPGCYEAQFCPDCPEEDVQASLRGFGFHDSSVFARESWCVHRGLNSDTLRRTYDPDSASDMADVMQLLAKRDLEGGRINLAIVRKGLVVRMSGIWWTVWVANTRIR